MLIKGERNIFGSSIVVHFYLHAIFDLIVLNQDVVFVDRVTFLKPYLFGSSACVSAYKQLKIGNGVRWIALDSHFATEAIVADDLHHGVLGGFGRRNFEFNGLAGAFGLELGHTRLVFCFFSSTSSLYLIFM